MAEFDEDKQETRIRRAANAGLAGGFVLGIAFCIGSCTVLDMRNPYYNLPRHPADVETYDINNDNRMDLILPDGSVKIQMADGGYMDLGDIMRAERRKISKEFERKYTFAPLQERNGLDNLDYKVSTGRYVLRGEHHDK